ncbi:polysaccharide deacetylase family protein [Paenibacillus peoriae]|uniref:polysaccharide deacetylase family protein n=1 Tax=Paenibacillus peoriae TaxID=59893 RepID=UPI003F9766F7
MDFAVMYHYVRERNGWNGIHPLLPHVFAEQIDAILQTHQIVGVEELRKPSGKPKAIITFDDGTKDQYQYAFDILRKKGVPAYFAVMSGPRTTGTIPLVHLVHTVLSFVPDEQLWNTLSTSHDTNKVPEESSIYHYETNLFRRYNKYVLNFMLNEAEARKILESIFKTIFPDPTAFIQNYYLSDSEIMEMDRAGMTIGVHCHNHIPYYDNAEHYYQNEILPCKTYLEQLGIVSKWYTPPFGGGKLFGKMQQDLTPILMKHGFEGGFSTNSGIIDDSSDFWFPRLDCNKFSINSSLIVKSVLSAYR